MEMNDEIIILPLLSFMTGNVKKMKYSQFGCIVTVINSQTPFTF